jgi:hypothetical protein
MPLKGLSHRPSACIVHGAQLQHGERRTVNGERRTMNGVMTDGQVPVGEGLVPQPLQASDPAGVRKFLHQLSF